MSKVKLEVLSWAAQLICSLMTDEEKTMMHKQQAVSFVYGNVKLSNPSITEKQVERIINKSRAQRRTK